jgi:hypothetical protein
MSYDIYFEVDGGNGPITLDMGSFNYTYNLSEYFKDITGKHLSDWNQMEAGEFMDATLRGLQMEAHPERYQHGSGLKPESEYEPGNGWGSVRTARHFLWELCLACAKAPNARLRVT